MNGPILQSTLRELQAILSLPRIWLVFFAIVALFAVTGPFGTSETLAFHARVGYWLVIHGFAWLLALTFVTFFDAALAGRIGHSLSRMMIGAALAALPIGVVIMTVTAAAVGSPVSWGEYVDDVFNALPVSLALCLLAWLAISGAHLPPASEVAGPVPAEPQPAPRAAILDRLPAEKRGSLVRMEVEDHYVRVVTSKGTELLLMRLADAIRETKGIDGCQVHRSHWVARTGAETLDREPGKNGRAILKTADGATVPVSRANVAKVRAWLG